MIYFNEKYRFFLLNIAIRVWEHSKTILVFNADWYFKEKEGEIDDEL